MRTPTAELAVTALLVMAVCMEGRDAWAMLAKGCQVTAAAVGRVGLYAEARATVLTAETA